LPPTKTKKSGRLNFSPKFLICYYFFGQKIFFFKNPEQTKKSRVLELAYEIYTDAHIGTCSAWSLPQRRLSRKVAAHVSRLESNAFVPYTPKQNDLMYNNPVRIAEIRHEIANHLRNKLRTDLQKAWACYYLQDASVDLKQHDNEFHMACYVDWETGELKNSFCGVVEKHERGAKGQISAFKECLSRLYPDSVKVNPDDIFKMILTSREEKIKESIKQKETVLSEQVPKEDNFDDIVDFENFTL